MNGIVNWIFFSPHHATAFHYNTPTPAPPLRFVSLNLLSANPSFFFLGNCFALFVLCSPTSSPSSCLLASTHFSLVLHTVFLLILFLTHLSIAAVFLFPLSRMFHLIVVFLGHFLLTAAPFHTFLFMFTSAGRFYYQCVRGTRRGFSGRCHFLLFVR